MLGRVKKRWKKSCAIAMILAVLFPVIACGGGSGAPVTTSPSFPSGGGSAPAAPSISNIVPSSIVAGAPLPVINVFGSGFTATSQVLIDGKPLSAIFQDSGYLQATPQLGVDSTAGNHQISVSQNKQTSNAAAFTIYAPSSGPRVFSAIPSYYATDGYDFGPVLVADVNGDHFADVL